MVDKSSAFLHCASMKYDRNPILIKVFAHFGTMVALAKTLGLTRQAISKWKNIPLRHVTTLSNMTGIPRERLRPDIYEESEDDPYKL
jgi:Putative antitoxin of bacterial toxin-antitoxin system, YdaS/YdaT